MLYHGDEFGIKTKTNVFNANSRDINDKNRAFPNLDFSNFISEVNLILRKMPQPIFPEWTQRVYLKSKPELLIVIVHQGWGHDGNSSLIVVNPTNQKITFDLDDLLKSLQANGRNNLGKTSQPKNLFLCGDLLASPNLPRTIDIHSSREQQKVTSL